MAISTKLSPSPNLIFSRIRSLFDKSFSFNESSLPLLQDYFYLEGVVTDNNGTPVAGVVVSIKVNGEPYLLVTTLSDGSFRFKLPVSWEDTVRVEVSCSYGENIVYWNFYDILVIAWIYAHQYLAVLQHLAQSKQDSYSVPEVGDVLQPLFTTDVSSYKTLERTLRRRFKNWPFAFLEFGTPEFKNLSSLRFWQHHSTFHIALQAIKDVIGADDFLLLPYDEYRLFHQNVNITKVAPRSVQVDASHQRVARRTGYFRQKVLTEYFGVNGDYYVLASIDGPQPVYQLSLAFGLLPTTATLLGPPYFRTSKGGYADFEGWTYAVPAHNIYRPYELLGIWAPWGSPLPEAGFSESAPDEIQLRVTRYWPTYWYVVNALHARLLLGAVRFVGGEDITNIWTYAELVGYQKVDSLDLAGDGELYFFKNEGWTEEQIKRLGRVLESGGLASRQFYTMFNPDPPDVIMQDLSYGYLDKKWGGVFKGFINWRRL